jgi:site-specific recombinase XerD
MEGFNPWTIQQLLGHEDLRMTMRYSYLAAEHLRQAVNRVDTVIEGTA